MGCKTCRELLSEGLDLCVRARAMDAIDRRTSTLAVSKDPEGWLESGKFDEHVRRHNAANPDQPIEVRSLTMPLWVMDQYEKDLAQWERKGRKHLLDAKCENAALPEAKADE